MDLSVEYLGLTLAHPLLPGASPLADEVGTVRALEDAGAPAIVMRSLFEEQLTQEQLSTFMATEQHRELSAEASSVLPEPADYRMGPDRYLEMLRKIRAAVNVPVIASLNGTTLGGWIDFARLMEQAGASALELNLYAVPTDPARDGSAVERDTLELVRTLKGRVKIPVAVKLSPFYTSVASIARGLEEAGADALVLFNRLFEPEIDVEALEVKRVLHLSDSSELPLRLRWLAILSAQRKIPLAISGGGRRLARRLMHQGGDLVIGLGKVQERRHLGQPGVALELRATPTRRKPAGPRHHRQQHAQVQFRRRLPLPDPHERPDGADDWHVQRPGGRWG